MITTARLALREFAPSDAAFIVELLNDPDWLAHIGDRGVRTTDDAVTYLANGPQASYARYGYGLWCVERRDTPGSIGMCGLVRRDWLDAPDVGFAFLPAHRRQGYAFEAAGAVIAHAQTTLGAVQLHAIVAPGNAASHALVQRLGFSRDTSRQAPASSNGVVVYTMNAASAANG